MRTEDVPGGIDYLLNERRKDALSGDYGMFSAQGNKKVGAIVALATKDGGSREEQYQQALLALDTLSRNGAFAEATDTEVRERVWEVIGG